MVEIGELMDQVFTGTPAIIDDLLFQGTYILAGAPKIGKSFLVAQIAYHVSTGQSFWGHSIHPGPVLYLALEDQYRRIQERMARMFGVEYQGNLLISVSAKRIGLGLDGQMEYFLEQYPKARLIAMLSVEEPVWQGSATQLADLLGEPYSPSGIVRQLNVCASRLAQYHNIHYEHQRTRHGSSITLTLEIQPV